MGMTNYNKTKLAFPGTWNSIVETAQGGNPVDDLYLPLFSLTGWRTLKATLLISEFLLLLV